MNQDLINKVYMEAMKLKKTSLSEIELVEKLTVMGYPKEIAQRAAKDVLIERTKDAIAKGKERIKIGVVLLFLGFLILIAGVIWQVGIVIPGGLLATGFAFLAAGLWAQTQAKP